MLFFALNASKALGLDVATSGGFELAQHEERAFDGGEHKARPLADVSGQDVYVLHSLNGEPGASANDKLLRLLFFLAACRDHGAARVTAIAPYLAYSRKDRRTKWQDPVTTRYVGQLFETVGVDGVMTLQLTRLSELLGQVVAPTTPAADPAPEPEGDPEATVTDAIEAEGDEPVSIDPEAVIDEGEPEQVEEGPSVDDAFGDLSDG